MERQLKGTTAVTPWEVIHTTPASPGSVFAYTDPDLVAGKVHSYRVRYFYGAGFSDFRLYNFGESLIYTVVFSATYVISVLVVRWVYLGFANAKVAK